jgi:hypothetical protein
MPWPFTSSTTFIAQISFPTLYQLFDTLWTRSRKPQKSTKKRSTGEKRPSTIFNFPFLTLLCFDRFLIIKHARHSSRSCHKSSILWAKWPDLSSSHIYPLISDTDMLDEMIRTTRNGLIDWNDLPHLIDDTIQFKQAQQASVFVPVLSLQRFNALDLIRFIQLAWLHGFVAA